MTRALGRRLARIEADHNPAGRVVVVQRHEEESDEQALALAGITPNAADLLVFIRHFGEPPADRTPIIHAMKG